MAIKGISDIRRLPIIGTIRLGEKLKNAAGKEYPSKLDHFNFKDALDVQKVYGDKCRELDIVIPVDDEELFFNQALKAYRLSGLFCACSDTVTATRVRIGEATEDHPQGRYKKGSILDPQGENFITEQGLQVKVGERFQMPCAGSTCPFTLNKMCRGIGRLVFMIPSVPKFGCFLISTTSFHSMVDLNSYLTAIRNVAGRISNIPLKLRLVPKAVSPNGKKSTIYVLKVEFAGTIEDLRGFKDNAMIAAPLPKTAVPSEEDIDKQIPGDLVPFGGKALSEQTGDAEIIEGSQTFEGDAQEEAPAEQAAKALEQPAPPKPKPAAQPKRTPGKAF